MPYIGAGIQRFNTADNLTVSGTSELKNDVTVTGDVTASGTVLPTGDTASGDAAAIGFTSTEGLILTGQGSTSDVVIKNDADTTVCFVPTGTDDLKFNDNAALIFGTGGDLSINHDGSNSFITDGGTGALYIQGTNGVFIRSADGGENLAFFTDDGSVELYHNNTKRIETTSVGVGVDQLFGLSDTDTGIALGANGADIMQFYTGNSERVRIQAGGGISFNGDTAAANALDDYEEGLHVTTATPNTSGSITLSSGSDTLAYTKIGRLVHISGEVSISSISSPVGSVVDFTVPFACSSLSETSERSGGGVFWTDNGTGYFVLPAFTFSGAIIRIFKDASAFSVNDALAFGFSYITDS